MEAALQIEYLSVEDYLAGEETSLERHEYIVAYAMAGGTDTHNEISLNIAMALRAHLRGGPCRLFMAEVKARLKFAQRTNFYYPDLSHLRSARHPQDFQGLSQTGRRSII